MDCPLMKFTEIRSATLSPRIQSPATLPPSQPSMLWYSNDDQYVPIIFTTITFRYFSSLSLPTAQVSTPLITVGAKSHLWWTIKSPDVRRSSGWWDDASIRVRCWTQQSVWLVIWIWKAVVQTMIFMSPTAIASIVSSLGDLDSSRIPIRKANWHRSSC
jgi:hypothetical protein